MSAYIPSNNYHIAAMIPHLSIDPIAMSPHSALIHNTLCHIPNSVERHCNITSSLFDIGYEHVSKLNHKGRKEGWVEGFFLGGGKLKFDKKKEGRERRINFTSLITKMAECHEQLGRVVP